MKGFCVTINNSHWLLIVFIDWYRLINCFSSHRFPLIGHPGCETMLCSHIVNKNKRTSVLYNIIQRCQTHKKNGYLVTSVPGSNAVRFLLFICTVSLLFQSNWIWWLLVLLFYNRWQFEMLWTLLWRKKLKEMNECSYWVKKLPCMMVLTRWLFKTMLNRHVSLIHF